MIRFNRILFPVDCSPHCCAAAPFVKAMAKRFGSEVTVLHVVETGRLQSDVSETLNRFVADELSDVTVTVELTEGDAAQKIVNYAEGHATDLIMMQTHGYGPFRTLLLGSVAAKVLHDARCPVWTGVHAEQMTAHSPDHWKRILCALGTNIDREDESGHLLQWTSEFVSGQNVELRVVHAVAGTNVMWSEQTEPSMYEFLFDSARKKLESLQAKAGTNLEIVLLAGNVASVVRSAAREWNADLIVIGRGVVQQTMGQIWSHAYSIIREAPCPVISKP